MSFVLSGPTMTLEECIESERRPEKYRARFIAHARQKAAEADAMARMWTAHADMLEAKGGAS